MLSIPQVAAAVIAMSLLTSCTTPIPRIRVAPTPTRLVPDRAAVNIHRYVAQQKGWRRSVYYIQRYPAERGHAVFEVVYRGRQSLTPPTLGGGESFILYCDSQTFKIIQELAQQ